MFTNNALDLQLIHLVKLVWINGCFKSNFEGTISLHQYCAYITTLKASDAVQILFDLFPDQMFLLQANADDNHFSLEKRSGLQGIPWKDFSRGGFSLGRDESMGKMSGKGTAGKGDKSEPVRKSRRVPKRRLLDEDFGDDDEDDEIRYLEKLKTSKVTGYKEDEEESSKKHRKLSAVSNIEYIGSSRLGNAKKKSKSDRVSGDTDYEEEDSVSDSELDGKKKKKQRKENVDSLMDGKREMTLTTRQRALQSSKDASSAPGASFIEFPNGLPPAPSRSECLEFVLFLKVLVLMIVLMDC